MYPLTSQPVLQLKDILLTSPHCSERETLVKACKMTEKRAKLDHSGGVCVAFKLWCSRVSAVVSFGVTDFRTRAIKIFVCASQ